MGDSRGLLSEVKEVVVTQGRIHVNAVERVINRSNVKVYVADLRAKRADIVSYVRDDLPNGEVQTGLLLDVGPNTLFTEHHELATGIFFRGDWYIIADVSKYSLYVALFDYSRAVTVFLDDVIGGSE